LCSRNNKAIGDKLTVAASAPQNGDRQAKFSAKSWINNAKYYCNKSDDPRRSVTDSRAHQALCDAVANLASDIQSYDECDPFDLQKRWRFAKRMTGEIFLVAVSRGNNQVSLLDALGLAEQTRIPSCAENGGVFGAPLLSLFATPSNAVFTAGRGIDDSMPRLTVSDWLQEVIYQSKNFYLTRQDILSTIRDKEGVAHFDEKITQESGYSSLRNSGHEEYHWDVSHDCSCTAVSCLGERLFIVASAPEKVTNPPSMQGKNYPMLGGVDGSVRTIAEELSSWLNESGWMNGNLRS